MKSLKSLESLIKNITDDEAILNKVRATMPVYEFYLLAQDYEKVAQYLISSKNYNVSKLVDNVFVKGEAYKAGIKANWTTLSKLLDAGIQVKDIQEDNVLLAVYTRLAVLAKTIADSSDKVANNLRIKSDLVHGLLTNTSAFSELLNYSLQYTVDSQVSSTDTKAVYTIDISASTGIDSGSLLNKLARKQEKLGITLVASSILAGVNNPLISELSAKFLDSAVKEFQGKVSPNSLVMEVNSFATKGKTLVSEKFKAAAMAAKKAALSIDYAVLTNKIEKTTLFEPEVKEAVPQEELKSAANLKSILNHLLAKAIENRMAPANVATNRRYLRYQTGTFANSAKVEYVEPSPTGKILNIGYSYKHDPYKDLYTKTGKYAGVGIGLFFSARGRDVQYIIQSAIQDIAKNLITQKLSIKPI